MDAFDDACAPQCLQPANVHFHMAPWIKAPAFHVLSHGFPMFGWTVDAIRETVGYAGIGSS